MIPYRRLSSAFFSLRKGEAHEISHLSLQNGSNSSGNLNTSFVHEPTLAIFSNIPLNLFLSLSSLSRNLDLHILSCCRAALNRNYNYLGTPLRKSYVCFSHPSFLWYKVPQLSHKSLGHKNRRSKPFLPTNFHSVHFYQEIPMHLIRWFQFDNSVEDACGEFRFVHCQLSGSFSVQSLDVLGRCFQRLKSFARLL